jgi:hypothetical protein
MLAILKGTDDGIVDEIGNPRLAGIFAVSAKAERPCKEEGARRDEKTNRSEGVIDRGGIE